MSTRPDAGALAGFQDAMHALASRGLRVDIRVYELATAEAIVADLQPTAIALLSDTTSLLGRIIEHCARSQRPSVVTTPATEAVRTSYLPFERAIDATIAMSAEGSYAAIEEIGFIAQLELRQRAEHLRRLTSSHGSIVLLSECDSSLRRVRKALNAVDAAIAKVEAVPSRLAFTPELETSLAVRRAYAKFRARLLAGGEPRAETIRSRIRGVGTQIAVVVGWRVYPDMRVRDRLLLRELQQRVLSWLREGEKANVEAGLRLWRDVVSAVEMFMLINRRQELCEHDHGVAREIAAFMASAPETGGVDAAVWQRASALEGLDPELDALLTRESRPSMSSLRPVLSRLVTHITTMMAPPGSGEDW